MQVLHNFLFVFAKIYKILLEYDLINQFFVNYF